MDRGVLFLLIFVVFIISIMGVYAQENNSTSPELISEDDSDNFFEGYEDETLQEDGGITPDSALYFLDNLFERCSIESKEEKIAEIKQMIEEGNIESARVSLENYMDCAEELENEIGPGERDEAIRSAAAIRNVMNDIRDQLPPGERGEFVSDVRSREYSIATAAEIASKINELCRQLSELDPNLFYEICQVGDEGPKWHKELYKDLSDEQKKEAKEFAKIMKQCFKTSGQDCACEEIPYPDFAEACSIAAPLATACDIGGDERACEQLDDLEMPKLPPHLQDIFEEIDDASDSRYDIHMPPECVEAVATTRNECAKIMVTTNAPEECKDTLLELAEAGEVDRYVFEEACEKIMMEIHAPDCAEKGITDPDECVRYMDSFRGDDGRGPGPSGPNCMEIENDLERLRCFENREMEFHGIEGVNEDESHGGFCLTREDFDREKQKCRDQFGESAGDEVEYAQVPGETWECPVSFKCVDFSQGKISYEEIIQQQEQCAVKCDAEGKAWDFSYGECYCKEGPYGDGGGGNYWEGCEAILCLDGYYCEYGECKQHEGYVAPGEGGESQVQCDDCASQCEDRAGERLAGTGCGPNGCECYYESDEPQYAEGEGPGEPSDYEGTPPDDSTTSIDSGTSTDDTSTTEPEPEPDTTNTGAVISGNAFLDYYYG